jgi:DNA-directed RNA polymerase subunit N (RpoN/RPB10)
MVHKPNQKVDPAPPPLVPIRCYSCGFQIASGHAQYMRLVAEGVPARDALDLCGANRVCCRRMLLSQPTVPDTLTYFTE